MMKMLGICYNHNCTVLADALQMFQRIELGFSISLILITIGLIICHRALNRKQHHIFSCNIALADLVTLLVLLSKDVTFCVTASNTVNIDFSFLLTSKDKSRSQYLLSVQPVKTLTYGNRAFPACAPVLWNYSYQWKLGKYTHLKCLRLLLRLTSFPKCNCPILCNRRIR